MTVGKISRDILKKLETILSQVPPEDAKAFLNKIMKADRVFIFGMGRSGLAGRAFAMRLMHCGKRVFYVGEITSPPIKDGDVLVTISGSGKTSSVISIAKTAKKNKATLLALTSDTKSDLAELSDLVVRIKGRVKTEDDEIDYLDRQVEGEHLDLTPMGTLFELSCSIFLDTIIALLIKEESIDEKYMKKKHTNLE